uniref:Dynein axonemal intermediate chain 4 n=1 Tax=Propithecus coquereli TaxID=379532 RepID=A0A2K6FR43_PROCO
MTPGKHSRASVPAANAGKKGWWTTPQPVAIMPVSPANSRKQQNFALSNTQLRKSFSIVNPVKATTMKGYIGANQSRMAVSKTMVIVPELKMAEKMNIPSTKTVQVFDANGVDVTPRPLYHPDPHSGTAKPNKLLTSQEGSLGSEFIASYSLYQNTINPSMLGQFTRSVLGSSTVSKSSASTTESIAEDIEEPSFKRERLTSFTDLRVTKATPEKITKEDLEKNIEIILTETETLRFFDLPTVMVSVEAEEAEKVAQRNRKYDILCRNRLGNDLYVERMMQTFNGAPKNKDVQCEKIIMEDKGIMSTAWDLYDSYNVVELSPSSVKPSIIESSSKAGVLPKDQDERSRGSTIEKNSEASSLMDIENVILTKIHDGEEDHSDAILKSDKFHQDLFFMERVLMENIFQPKLAAYRQLPVLKEREPEEPKDFLESEKHEEVVEEAKKEEEEEIEIGAEKSTIPANLERLWSFSCDLTKGLNVSSLAWNKANPDLLAVGYGHFGFKEQKKGLACCWSIKNPMWPERIYQSPFGVIAVDFSIGAPNLLAVGYHNGTIAIYNVQNNSSVPILDSSYIVIESDTVIFETFNNFLYSLPLECSVMVSPSSSLPTSPINFFWLFLDPLIVHVANPGIKFTTILFAKQTDCLLVGDSDGQVAVYELRNMPTSGQWSGTGRSQKMTSKYILKSNLSNN